MQAPVAQIDGQVDLGSPSAEPKHCLTAQSPSKQALKTGF